MLASFLLSVREGVEAALVIGIVLAALRKMERRDLVPFVWRGLAAALAASLLAAAALQILDAEFEGKGEQIFEGVSMLAAAGLLTWMIFWMHRQGRSLQRDIENRAGSAVLAGGGSALLALVFLSVVREGIELSLFLLASRLASNVIQTLAGAALGLAAAVLVGWMLFSSARRLSLAKFFQVTNVVLVFFAAGLVSLAAGELIEAGLFPALVEHVWNINPILSDASGLGLALKTLFGYNGDPSLSEILAYGLYLGVIGFVLLRRRSEKRAPAAANCTGEAASGD